MQSYYICASRIDPDWRETGLEYRVTDQEKEICPPALAPTTEELVTEDVQFMGPNCNCQVEIVCTKQIFDVEMYSLGNIQTKSLRVRRNKQDTNTK